MSKGSLYIVPIPISENTLEKVIPEYNIQVVGKLRHFVVEKTKTARQFLRKCDRSFPIDDSTFFELNKHDGYSFQMEAIELLKNGTDVGLMSESGYPGVADPGSEFVALAHKYDIEIIPLIGPSSLLIAIAASGMNGQGFTFNGYLPRKEPDRSNKIKSIVQTIVKTGYAQLFIETPYRNESIFQDLIRAGNADLMLTIAYDVTGEQQKIKTKNLADWKKKPFQFQKTPCVFVLGK